MEIRCELLLIRFFLGITARIFMAPTFYDPGQASKVSNSNKVNKKTHILIYHATQTSINSDLLHCVVFVKIIDLKL